MELLELITRASDAVGSEYKLAKTMGISTGNISDWKAGRKRCTPEDWALMAFLCGLDPEEALIRAVLEKHSGSKKGEALMSALGKGFRATGAAAYFAICVSAGFLSTATEARASQGQGSATMYIMLTSVRGIGVLQQFEGNFPSSSPRFPVARLGLGLSTLRCC
jgi:hypothetical protein